MQHTPSREANRSQLVKKFSTFYGTQRFITALISARLITPDEHPENYIFIIPKSYVTF
jgi:hypothetical protein